MDRRLNIAAWNANGLCQHTHEVQTFIKNHNLDILLIQNDLNMPSVKDEATRYCQRYRIRLMSHTNCLMDGLLDNSSPRRLKRQIPADLIVEQ